MKGIFLILFLYLAVGQSVTAQIDPNIPIPESIKKQYPQIEQVSESKQTKPTETKDWAEGIVTGSVRKKDGAAIENALVSCAGKAALTDESGNYRISGILAGQHLVKTAACLLEGTRCKDPGVADTETIRWKSVSVMIGPKEPQKSVDFISE